MIWQGFGNVVGVGGCAIKYTPANFPTPKDCGALRMPRLSVGCAQYYIFGCPHDIPNVFNSTTVCGYQ